MGQYIFILARNLKSILLIPSEEKNWKTIKRNRRIFKEGKDTLFKAT